jgi:AAA+ ATPase superfamily predicted ATPase
MRDTSESLFTDRTAEIEYLKKYFESMPNSLLFVPYGLKSSGKSSFLEKVATNLDKKI